MFMEADALLRYILTFGYLVLYIQIYRFMERKNGFHVQNFPCGTVGAKIGYELGLLVHDEEVGEFGRKVFLVAMKNIKYGENKL